MSTQTARGTAWRFGPAFRASRAPRVLWQVPTFFTGLLALLVVAAGAAFRGGPAAGRLDREIVALREALKELRAPAAPLLPMAEHVLEGAREQPARLPEANFLGGVVYTRLAEQGPSDSAADQRRKAFLFLEQAEARGVAPQDLARLHYYLGKLLFQSGGDLTRAIDYLTRATPQGAEEPAEGYGMLTEAYLRLPRPDLAAALQANQKQLDNGYDDSVLAPASLKRGELLLEKGQRPEALKALRHVGPAAPPAVRLKARYLQARCSQDENLWGQAIPMWKEVLADPSVVPGGKGYVLYALGLCHYNADPRDEAEAGARWQDATREGGPYGQAAALRLAELRLQGREPATALDWFRQALDKVQSAKDYQNPLLGLDPARALFEAGCRVYREAQDHERAQQLAELYQRVALPGVAEQRLAEALEGRAAALSKKAAAMDGPEGTSLREEAVALYRKAAVAYEQSAEGRVPAEKAARLWNGASCHLQARDHARAVALLQQYVKLEVPPERQVEGWFALAGAHRALKQTDQAKEAYYECIKYPRSAFTYRARLELALVEAELHNLDQAEEILKQNLTLTVPSPDRAAEEQSLYKLAELLFQRRKFDQAEFRLKEAIRQFPDNAGVLAARDMLGECYRQMAEQAKFTSTDNMTADKQLIYKSVRQENLEKAYEVYQKLSDDLEARAASRRLASVEEELLRKALLSAVDCVFELPNNYPEAVRRYSQLAQRFRGRIEGLLVCQRLLNCCTLTGDASQARGALEAARTAVMAVRADLPQMPEAAFRTAGNTATKAQWQTWIEKVVGELERIPAVPPPGR